MKLKWFIQLWDLKKIKSVLKRSYPSSRKNYLHSNGSASKPRITKHFNAKININKCFWGADSVAQLAGSLRAAHTKVLGSTLISYWHFNNKLSFYGTNFMSWWVVNQSTTRFYEDGDIWNETTISTVSTVHHHQERKNDQ